MTGEQPPEQPRPPAQPQPPGAPPQQAPPGQEAPPGQAPPAPPEPADAVAPGFEAPSMVMDQDDLDSQITVNVEKVFKEIFLVKIVGTLWFVMALVVLLFMGFLGAILFSSDIEAFLGNMMLAIISLVLGIVGVVMAVLGFFARSIRKWMLYTAPPILIAAVAIGPLTSSIGELSLWDILLGLAFAIFWFLGVEYLHAITRFVEVGEMALKRKLTNFNLSGVVKHFIGYSFLVLGLVVLVTLGVVGFLPLMKSAFLSMIVIGGILVAVGVVGTLYLWLTRDVVTGVLFGLGSYSPGVAIILVAIFLVNDSEIFANSAELFSVFGLAIAAAVVFTVVGMVMTVYYSFAEGVAKVEKVEYSREKLQEMLASGQVLDLESGGQPSAPAGGEGP